MDPAFLPSRCAWACCNGFSRIPFDLVIESQVSWYLRLRESTGALSRPLCRQLPRWFEVGAAGDPCQFMTHEVVSPTLSLAGVEPILTSLSIQGFNHNFSKSNTQVIFIRPGTFRLPGYTPLRTFICLEPFNSCYKQGGLSSQVMEHPYPP